MSSQSLERYAEPGYLNELARLGQWLALSESGDASEKARGATAALRLYYAAELGLTPMAAAELTVIKGRLYVGAQLLRALAVRAGYQIVRVSSSETSCTARLLRSGEILGEETFTIEKAKTAGLVRSGSPWTSHPARMLWARASKNVIVDFAPEVALGMGLDDEIQEVTGEVLPTRAEVEQEIEDAEVEDDPPPLFATAQQIEDLKQLCADAVDQGVLTTEHIETALQRDYECKDIVELSPEQAEHMIFRLRVALRPKTDEDDLAPEVDWEEPGA